MGEINLQDRLAKVSGDELPTNCIGTALFLAGEVDIDEHIEPLHAKTYLEKLTELQAPEVGSIITWEEETRKGLSVEHAGLVVNVDPILITHRPGSYFFDCNARVVEAIEFRMVDMAYESPIAVNRYYRPSSRIVV